MNADQWSVTANVLTDSVWPLLTLLMFALLSIVLFASSQWRKNVRRRRLSRELAKKITANSPEKYEHIPVDADSVAGLRQDELQRYTETLEGLGFHKLADFRLQGSSETTPHSFGRCMLNKELRCFAEVMATRKILDASGPLLFGFSSFLEEEWSIGSTSGRSLKARYFRRLPRSLILCGPECSIEELFRRHMELRTRVTTDLGISALEDTSLEGYHQRIRDRMRVSREALLNRDILGEWEEATSIAHEGHWEWLGDYPEEAARRARGENLQPLKELSPTYSVPQSDALEQMRPTEHNKPDVKPDE
jgi:hypothetical protein